MRWTRHAAERSPALRLRTVSLALPALLLAGVLAPSSASTQADGDRHRGFPLPRFEGPTLGGGGRVGTDLLQGRRGLVYVFAATDDGADVFAGIVKRLREDAAHANITLIGVNRDLDRQRGRIFVDKHGFDFPVILDTDLRISRKLQVGPAQSALFVVDAEGFIIGGFRGISPEIEDPDETYEAYLRETLHLEQRSPVQAAFGVLPVAPDFTVTGLDGGAVKLAELRGKVVVLIFFLPTCPHCHELLKFVDGLRSRLAHPDLTILPVSIQNRRFLIENMVAEQSIQLAMYTDPDRETQKAYDHRLGVPDTLVIDREGRITARHRGAEARVEALVTMAVRQALGVPNPLLLPQTGYSGDDLCQVCHQSQHATWALTNHAYAFESLVEHGADRDPECLACHTVGWGETGGYSPETPYDHLQGVGCESCHGRGGPHQSATFLAQGYEAVCATCHTEKHSLNFVFADRLPEVSHAANQRFATLSLEERRALLERRDRRERTLFAKADFTGSDSCASCHAAEHAVWARGPHARAFASLEAKGDQHRDECARCHSTGFGEPGGYPDGGPALAGVGCESCHGPGGNHAGETAPRPGTILGLADKCDSCVILQICGSCHDQEWDPNFEFELESKLAVIRHGTAQTAEGSR